MFKFNSAHIVSNKAKTRRFIAAGLMAVSIGVLSLQAGFVLNANAEGNPITSPISYSESPAPTSTPTPTPSSSSAPITSPEVTPSPSATPTATPTPSASASAAPSAEPSVEPSAEPSTSPSVAPSASPSTTPAPSSQPSSNNSNSNSNGGGSVSAPSCNNEAPKAPVLVSAVTTGKNEITLTWNKALGPVTHYSVAYGVVKNKPIYGVSNVGNVTSFKVKGLYGGGTYFFKVRAVNDCTPGEFSNEIGVKVGGKFISTPAQGFKPGVLGKTTVKPVHTPAPSVVPSSAPQVNTNTSNGGLVGQILNFFKGLFN